MNLLPYKFILRFWRLNSSITFHRHVEVVLFTELGDKSPSGKLTMSMPQNMGQIPVYYNHLNTGHPVAEGTQKFVKFQSNYLDVRNEPLYPFGYGLSYTTFEYSDMTLSSGQMPADGSITASVTVKSPATLIL